MMLKNREGGAICSHIKTKNKNEAEWRDWPKQVEIAEVKCAA